MTDSTPRPIDDIEMLAAISDGTIGPQEISDAALEELLASGGTEILAEQLAERSAMSDGPVSIPLRRAWAPQLVAAAAVLVITAGVLVQFLPRGGGGSGLAWDTPLRGKSGFLDGASQKGGADALRSLLMGELPFIDAVPPRVIDIDGDGAADGIAFGFIGGETLEEQAPWAFAVFDVASGQELEDDHVARWGIDELASSGSRGGILSTAGGQHAFVDLGDGGAVVYLDENGDGQCDAAWSDASQVSGCEGSIFSSVSMSAGRLERLNAMYTGMDAAGLPRLDMKAP
ncbi:MAG: hypothetical protein AAF356_05135 [Planctomycetota bacterium]